LKNSIPNNWTGGVAQGEGPEFKPQYRKKKKKKKKTQRQSEIQSHISKQKLKPSSLPL
jgi:hypothetical protein